MDNKHKEREIEKTVSFKLSSLVDLLRLVVSSNQKAAHIFYFEKDGKHIYGVSNVIPAYFDLKGLPAKVYLINFCGKDVSQVKKILIQST